MAEQASKPLVEVIAVTDGHATALAEFFRVVWDPEANAEKVLQGWRASEVANPIHPGEPPPTFVFLVNERVVGYVSSIPIRVWRVSAEAPAYWVKGLMVLPEFRNGPIGFLLLKEAVRHLHCALALAVAPAARRLFEALGFSDLGVLDNYIRILRPSNVLARLDLKTLDVSGLPGWVSAAVSLAQRFGMASLLGGCVGLLTPLWIAIRRGRIGNLEIVPDAQAVDPSELDSLWVGSRARLEAAPVRDSGYLRSRYEGGCGSTYQFIKVRRGSTLVGLAVVRKPREESDPRLRGIRVATVSDLIFPLDDPTIGLAALGGAEAVAQHFDADAVLCSASHPGLLNLLPRYGYLRVPGNLHFLLRDVTGEPPFPSVLSAWYLTRGDSNTDEVF